MNQLSGDSIEGSEADIMNSTTLSTDSTPKQSNRRDSCSESCGVERHNFWHNQLQFSNSIQFVNAALNDYKHLRSMINHPEKGEISRDVLRTFPQHSFFRSESIGSKMLSNILHAFVLFRPEIGYCQGMNFVTAIFMLGRLPPEYSGGLKLNKFHSFMSHSTVCSNSSLDSSKENYSTGNDNNNNLNNNVSSSATTKISSSSSSSNSGSNRNDNAKSMSIRLPIMNSINIFKAATLPGSVDKEGSLSGRSKGLISHVEANAHAVTRNGDEGHLLTPQSVYSLRSSMLSSVESVSSTIGVSPTSAAVDEAESDDLKLDIEDFIRIEYDVFYNLLLLSDKCGKLGMGSLWSSGFSQIKLRAYQFDSLCKYIVPALHTHFMEIQLQPEVLVAQWFITLFAYTVPLRILLKLWDYIFEHGWPGVFQIAMSLLKCFEKSMLPMDLEGISGLLKRWRLKSQEFNDFDCSVAQSSSEASDPSGKSSSSMQHTKISSSNSSDESSRYIIENHITPEKHPLPRSSSPRSLSDSVELYEQHLTYEEIMRHVVLMPINTEVLQKLQESFALEMISMSEVTLSMSANSTGNNSDITSTNSGGSSSSSRRDSRYVTPTPGTSEHPSPSASARRSTSTSSGQSSNGNRAATGKSFSTAASIFLANNNSNNTSKSKQHQSSNSSKINGIASPENGSQAVSATTWLERYGDTISADVAMEMIRIRDDLNSLELQIDTDKEHIQSKILVACDVHREALAVREHVKARHAGCLNLVIALSDELEQVMSHNEAINQAVYNNIDEYNLSALLAESKAASSPLASPVTASSKSAGAKIELVPNTAAGINCNEYQTKCTLTTPPKVVPMQRDGVITVCLTETCIDAIAESSAVSDMTTESTSSGETTTAVANGTTLKHNSKPFNLLSWTNTFTRHKKRVLVPPIPAAAPSSSSSAAATTTTLITDANSVIETRYEPLTVMTENRSFDQREQVLGISPKGGVGGDERGTGGGGEIELSDLRPDPLPSSSPSSPTPRRQQCEHQSMVSDAFIKPQGPLAAVNPVALVSDDRQQDFLQLSDEAEVKPTAATLPAPVTAAAAAAAVADVSAIEISRNRSSSAIRLFPSLFGSSRAVPVAKSLTLDTSTTTGHSSAPSSATVTATAVLSTSVTPEKSKQISSKSLRKVNGSSLSAVKKLDRERSKRLNERNAALNAESRIVQQQVIALKRDLDVANVALAAAKEDLDKACTREEEALQRKELLCEQFQRLVEDASRGRAQKLQYITDIYL